MQNIYFGPDERAHQKVLRFFLYRLWAAVSGAGDSFPVPGGGRHAVLSADLFYRGDIEPGKRVFEVPFIRYPLSQWRIRAFSDADGDCHVGSYLCEWDLYLGVNENERENSGTVASVQ